MKLRLIVLLAAGTFSSPCGLQAQDMFRATFRANGRGLNEFNQLLETKVTERDIVREAVSAHGLAPRARRNHVLVYNVTNDSLQVINDTTGAVLSDVIQFEGGAAVTDELQAARFTFMFLPNATNSFGSAFLSEKWHGILAGDDNDRLNLTGRLQFALTDGQVLGGSNSLPVTTNSPPVGTNAPPVATNSPGTNSSSGDTNSLAIPVNGTNAPVTAINPTNGGTSTVITPPGTTTNGVTSTNGSTAITPSPGDTNSLAIPVNGTNPPATAINPGTGGTSTVITPPGTTTNGVTSTIAVKQADVAIAQAVAGETTALGSGSSPTHFASTALLATNATNVVVYTGTFTAGRRFLPNGADSPLKTFTRVPPEEPGTTNNSGTTNSTALP